MGIIKFLLAETEGAVAVLSTPTFKKNGTPLPKKMPAPGPAPKFVDEQSWGKGSFQDNRQ